MEPKERWLQAQACALGYWLHCTFACPLVHWCERPRTCSVVKIKAHKVTRKEFTKILFRPLCFAAGLEADPSR